MVGIDPRKKMNLDRLAKSRIEGNLHLFMSEVPRPFQIFWDLRYLETADAGLVYIF